MTGLVQLRSRGPEVRFRWLDALWIQVTGTLCNIACLHCFISCGPKADQVPMMSVEEVERALRDGRGAGMRQVYFTGGEPFLHPQLQSLTRAALQSAPLTIVTNGILIDDEAVRWIAEESRASIYSLDLRVSLDGMTAAQNDPVRGRGTFAQIVEALQRLGRAGLSPVVTVVEHDKGLAGAESRAQFLQFVGGLGIRQPRVKFLPLLRIGREERRTHGYQERNAELAAQLTPEVAGSLLCASGRVVTAQGVYTCPILIEHADARLGTRLEQTLHPIHLGWDACQTCVFDGLRCNT